MKNDNRKELYAPGRLAALLLEHSKWRRGIGKYKWNENPSKNADPPFTPSHLTEIELDAIAWLKYLSKCLDKKKLVKMAVK